MVITVTDKQSSDLTEEQKKKLRKVGIKFMLKETWNGINHGAMAILMCVLLGMANHMYLDDDTFTSVVGCIIIIVFILKRVSAVTKENVEDMRKEIEQITKQ